MIRFSTCKPSLHLGSKHMYFDHTLDPALPKEVEAVRLSKHKQSWDADANVTPKVELWCFLFDFPLSIQGPAKRNGPFWPVLHVVLRQFVNQVPQTSMVPLPDLQQYSEHRNMFVRRCPLMFEILLLYVYCMIALRFQLAALQLLTVGWWQDIAHDPKHLLCKIVDQLLPWK